jgi:hypothetical protein
MSAKKMHTESQTVRDMPAINILTSLLFPEAQSSLLHFHPYVNDTHLKKIEVFI